MINSAANTSIAVLLSISFLAILVVFIYGKPIIQQLYHIQQAQAQTILLFCTCTFIGLSLVLVFGSILTAYRKIKVMVLVTAIFCCCSILLNSIFIPAFGATATALIHCLIQLAYGITLAVICYRKQLVIFTPFRLKQVLKY
jgi:O-antigen/teichoic acid export membrane protein